MTGRRESSFPEECRNGAYPSMKQLLSLRWRIPKAAFFSLSVCAVVVGMAESVGSNSRIVCVGMACVGED